MAGFALTLEAHVCACNQQHKTYCAQENQQFIVEIAEVRLQTSGEEVATFAEGGKGL